jgi:hypothetical protein
MTIKRLGDLGRQVWKRKGIDMPESPDVATLAVDMGTACFRRSYFIHGKITPPYQAAAVQAMTLFLAQYADSATEETTPSRRARAAR